MNRNDDYLVLRGERYVRVETIARWYRVEVTVLEEAVELELVRHRREPDAGLLLPDSELDRVVDLLRWRWQTGLGLEAFVGWTLRPGR